MTLTTEAPASSPLPQRARSRTGLVTVALLAAIIALISIATYAAGTLDELAEDGAGLSRAYADAPQAIQMALYIHIGSGSLALVLGPLQFLRRLRDRAPRVHRVIGRTYFVSVAIGVASALVIVPFNSAGMVGFFGFGMLAALWGYTALRAYRAIRSRDVEGHQAWMFRNYALTFAAPTLRLWLLLLIAVQVPFAGAEPDVDALFANAYAAVPFLCWLPNIIVAEWLIRRRGLPSYRLSAAPL